MRIELSGEYITSTRVEQEKGQLGAIKLLLW